MIMRFKTIHPYLAALAVLFILCFAGFTYFFGPLDSFPRLHASAQSPDGTFTVKVYRKRVSLPPSSEIDLIAKVYDRQSNLVFEKKIFQEGMWSELNDLFRNIIFDGDKILIGPSFDPDWYYIIERADLMTTK
jgi:uncharacterized lipoprotein YbaY